MRAARDPFRSAQGFTPRQRRAGANKQGAHVIADVHADDDWALRWAVALGSADVVARLLAAGAAADVNANEPLMHALNRAERGIAQQLIDHGADAAAAWRRVRRGQKKTAATVLDAIAASIPSAHRAALLRESPRRFPAMRALRTVELRRAARRRPPTGDR